MYRLRTALLTQHAHVGDFWPVLPIFPCPFAGLPGMDPSPTIIHIEMREPERAGALPKKGWATSPWQQLQLALFKSTAVRFIPAPKIVNFLFGVISMQGSGVEIGGQDLPHH